MKRIALSLLLLVLLVQSTSPDQGYRHPDQQLLHKILKIINRLGEHPKVKHVAKIVEVSTKLGATCLPGVLDKNDFIAIAYTESKFNPHVVGLAGEVGAWQVLEWKELKKPLHIKNPFDIGANGAMVCKVLQSKWDKYHSYKKTIISYNGWGKHNIYFRKVRWFRGLLSQLTVASK